MDVSEYRKQYQIELENAAKQRASYRVFLDKSKPVVARQMAASTAEMRTEDEMSQTIRIIQDRKEDAELRVSALQAISVDIGQSHELLDMALALLRDDTESVVVRRAALRVLQQNTFSSAIFRSKRAEYLETLRALIDDKDTKLRQQAIEILAAEKDEYVQRRLLDQLQGRSKALVGTAKAIQLLGYDIHAEHYPILRQIIESPPSRAAKKEAVRLLASDPSSKEMLAEILRDKGEHTEVRKISAVALQSLAPAEFEEHAKQIVLDDNEDDALRATSVNALAQFADPSSLSQESELNRYIQELNETATSKQLKQATSRYISRYGE